MWLMDIYLTVEIIHITCLLFHGTHFFVTVSGAVADEKPLKLRVNLIR